MNTDLLLAIAAFSAVGISIISMFFTVMFSKQQIRHNKNSVRPICTIKFKDYEQDIAVSIANVGTGPLTIKEIVCDDKDRKAPTLLALMPRIDQYWATYTEDMTGWTIPVGGESVLIGLKPESDAVKTQVRYTLAKISIRVVYSDIYGTEFEERRNLDFFGRLLGSEFEFYTKRGDRKEQPAKK
jgi:hypothetical protein